MDNGGWRVTCPWVGCTGATSLRPDTLATCNHCGLVMKFQEGKLAVQWFPKNMWDPVMERIQIKKKLAKSRKKLPNQRKQRKISKLEKRDSAVITAAAELGLCAP